MEKAKNKCRFWIVVLIILIAVNAFYLLVTVTTYGGGPYVQLFGLYLFYVTTIIELPLIGLRIYCLNEIYLQSRLYAIVSGTFIALGFVISNFLAALARFYAPVFLPALFIDAVVVIYFIRKIIRKNSNSHQPTLAQDSLRMNLQPKYLNYIKNGTKRIELRLLDQKRQNLKIGDQVELYDDYGNEITCRVTGLFRYNNFEELIKDFDISLLADSSVSPEELLHDLSLFYPSEKQSELGVIGIRLEPISLGETP